MNVIPLRVDLPCDVEPSSPEAARPSPLAPAADERKPARECAGSPPRQIASTAQIEARMDAWIKHELEIYRIAEEGFRKEVDAMCARIAARRAAGIPDPIEHKPNEATSDYQTESDAGWDWRI